MARRPKVERQYDKAAATAERKQAASMAEPSCAPRHPTHVAAARAFGSERSKLERFDRDHNRATGRELRAEGWNTVQRLDGGWQCTGQPPWQRLVPGQGQVVSACRSGRDYEKAEAIWRLPARESGAQR